MMLEDLSSENLPYGPWTDQLDLDESDGEENFDIKLVSLGLISLILITISLIWEIIISININKKWKNKYYK